MAGKPGRMMAAAFALAALPFVVKGPCNIVAFIPGGTAMGLIMTIIPVLRIASAAIRLSGGLLAILKSSELPMGVIAGCLLLGETTTPFKAFGLVIISASIVLSNVVPSGKGKAVPSGKEDSGIVPTGDPGKM